MRTPISYYRRLRERLGIRARALRDLVVDRIFLWHERDRARTNMLLARVDGWHHDSFGYTTAGVYACRCGHVLHGDSVAELKQAWYTHREGI